MRTKELIQRLKRETDLHDLAQRLGLVRPGGGAGNYRSPHHDDKSPSLEIAPARNRQSWTDYSAAGDEGRGDAIDLVQYVQGSSWEDAVEWLAREYGLGWDRGRTDEPARPKTWAETLAERVLAKPEQAMEYLVGERKIPEAAVAAAIRAKAIGFNDWSNPKVEPGNYGHGGPAVCFVVRTFNPGHVVAVDMRYLDAELNGGVKTNSQGEKSGYPWTSDLRKLREARKVFVVESAINVLSIDGCNIPGAAAVAIRGNARVVDQIDWRFAAGKQVYIACDHDEPDKRTGYCPGLQAAWAIHEKLLAQDIAAQLIDTETWDDFNYNDLNDIIKSEGVEGLRIALNRVEPWAIPGLPGNGGKGKTRVYLPPHDFAQYWRYRVHSDFMTVVTKVERDKETNEEKPSFKELAGFRLAGISRVSVCGFTSVMTGELDHSPRVYFAVAIQAPRHGATLQRKVIEDEKLHNLDQWKRFGPVFDQAAFLRLVNIFERAAHIGSRRAVNLVGLAWKDGALCVNEGPDCYFMEPRKQCKYSNLRFPTGSTHDARRVLQAYADTFRHNAALIPLVWGLGGHTKVVIGKYPHAIMQADKGAGKSTLIKRLERTLAFEMLSGQSMQTAFRLVTSVSCTTHPIGWEELSAQDQRVISEACDLLQETYQYTITHRGADMLEFLLCAPVLLAGEDVPVKTLLSKVIRTDLTDRQGELLPEDLPPFPVREWLEHLAAIGPARIREVFDQARQFCRLHNRADARDRGAERIGENYAILLTTWYLLADWVGFARDRAISLRGDGQPSSFEADVVEEMNRHVKDTGSDRQPWVWIMETIINEIAAGEFRHPHKIDAREIDGVPVQCLVLRPAHVMAHISGKMALRDRWNSFPIKTDRVLKRQLKQAGVILEDRVDITIKRRRESHMVALSIPELERWGLYVGTTEGGDDDQGGMDY